MIVLGGCVFSQAFKGSCLADFKNDIYKKTYNIVRFAAKNGLNS